MANSYNFRPFYVNADANAKAWQITADISARTARELQEQGRDQQARRWQEHAALDAQQARWNMGIE